MKKLLLASAIAFFGAVTAQKTGNFKVGANIGIVNGDLKSAYGLNVGLDAAYAWALDSNFNLGLATGYSFYFVDSAFFDAGGKNLSVIPLAVTGQYKFDKGYFVGADLGYAALLYNGDSKGGFLYQPKIGYSFNDKNDVYISYKGITQTGGNVTSLNLGYAFKF